MLGLPTPPAEPVKKGAKKKDEELPAVPAEPPRRVRHGKGEYSAALSASKAVHHACLINISGAGILMVSGAQAWYAASATVMVVASLA